MNCVKNMLLGAMVGAISVITYQQYANGNIEKMMKTMKKDCCKKLESMS